MQDDTKRWDDSLISLGLGALVVVVSGILLYNYFTDQTPKILQNQTQSLVSASPAQVAQSTEQPAGVSTPIPLPTNAPTVAPTSTVAPTVQPTQTPRPTTTPTVAPTATPAPTQTVAPTQTPAPTATPVVAQNNDSKTLPTKHTVVAGDTLWGISEKYYGSGFEWKKIASANNIGPGTGRGLEIGASIEIPKNEMISATSTETAASAQPQATNTPAPTSVAQASPTPSTQPTQGATGGSTVQPATGTITYTVARGDSLWKIAGEKCGNNYTWSSIAKQNKLVNPSVIHAGNVLTFSCQ